MIQDRVTLNNGTTIPWLGLGVFKMTDTGELDRAVKSALEIGYRSIDTAAVYGNESAVGKAIRESGVKRSEIFLTTKVWNEEQVRRNVAGAFEESLERLETDYVDLYLVHWPVRDRIAETWAAMEEILASGRAKAIGVSNFLKHHLDELPGGASTVPAVNQIEFHPYLVQPDLLDYCKSKGIQPEAWSPLMRGAVASDPSIVGLARKYGKTPAQIVLRWDLQRGVVTIPKSVRPERIAENAGIFDFELGPDDVETLNGLDAHRRLGPDPDKFGY